MTRLLAVIAALAVLGAGAMWLTTDRGSQTTANDLLGSAANAQEAADIDISTVTEMQIGNPDAKVTVIEYASFTCPHCATFHNGPFKQLKADYIDTGKINFIYREVYFDRFGLWASMVARCAGPDRFFGLTELIYAGQSEWARAGDPVMIADELRKIGRLAGMDNATLDACLADETQARTLVAWFQANAEEHGIESTPSFVIDGETHGNMPYADMAALIEEGLAD